MPQITAYTDDAVQVRTLSNGLTVTLETLPYLHSASAGVWIKTGSGNESAEQAGISHFLEHLFFKGTTTRSARELMEAVEGGGGHLNAFTSRDHTCLYVRTLDTHLAIGLEILADIVKNSQFPDLEKERNVVLEEIASIEDVPEDFVHDLLTLRLWPDHAFGRPITGDIETVSRLSLDDIRTYFREWYQPQNLIISVAGNFEESAVFEQIASEFESLVPGDGFRSSDRPQPRAGVERCLRDIAQNHIGLAFPGPDVNDPRRYAYDLLSSALGGGSTSRLFDRIREKAGLVYSIYSFHSCYSKTGLLGLYSAVTPENLGTALDMIYEELRKLRDEPLSSQELELNREQIKGGMLIALESTSNRMSRMAKSMLYYGRIVPIEETIAAIDAVTADDLQTLAQELFCPERCAGVILGPETNGDVTQVQL
ncbi:MAG: insulinase family protein [Candidatus Hydrogenedentes bacterium]|nr:insulinase family protein [Candidatus Hydrogenedentota bacterium]